MAHRDSGGPDEPSGAGVSLGLRLRSRRDELGLNLTDVEAATKIRARYLNALEAGNVYAMPGPVYAVGFARSYAEYLGLSGDDAARDLRIALGMAPDPAVATSEALTGVSSLLVATEFEPPAPPPPGDAAPRPAAASTRTAIDSPSAPTPAPRPARPARTAKPGRVRRARRRIPPAPVRTSSPADVAGATSAAMPARRRAAAVNGATGQRSWLILVLALVVVCGAYLVYRAATAARPGGGDTPGGGGNGGPNPEPQLTIDRIETRSVTAGQLEVIVDWDELLVSLSLSARTWLRCEVDGQLIYEGTAPAGEVIDLPDGRQVSIRTGRAKQTDIAIGGIDIGAAGPVDGTRSVTIIRTP